MYIIRIQQNGWNISNQELSYLISSKVNKAWEWGKLIKLMRVDGIEDRLQQAQCSST